MQVDLLKSKISGMKMTSLFLTVLYCFTLCQSAMAQDKDVAEKMIQSTMDAVILVLQEQNLSEEGKSTKIEDIVAPMFNFPQMAKLTLGKKYWPGLTQEEQELQLMQNETLLRSIAISGLERVDLVSNETRQYVYEISIPAEISPGLTYGSISYEWTCWGMSLKVSPTGFPVTYVRNKEYEELRDDYQALNLTYWSLQGNYTELESQYSGELGSTRNVMYILIVTTVVSVASVFFLIRRPKKWF